MQFEPGGHSTEPGQALWHSTPAARHGNFARTGCILLFSSRCLARFRHYPQCLPGGLRPGILPGEREAQGTPAKPLKCDSLGDQGAAAPLRWGGRARNGFERRLSRKASGPVRARSEDGKSRRLQNTGVPWHEPMTNLPQMHRARLSAFTLICKRFQLWSSESEDRSPLFWIQPAPGTGLTRRRPCSV